MEIDKMLTISTAHITCETCDKLYECVNVDMFTDSEIDLCVYEKKGYGYFIHIPDDYEDREIPKDLMECIELALEHDCSWLCLDRDAMEVDELQRYDW